MGNVNSSWLVGSARIPQQGLSIDGGAYVWPAGYYYLRHPTDALSMIDTLRSILSSAGVAGASVVVQKNRKVRVSFTPGSEFNFVWPADHLLRDLFGFVTNIGLDASQEAEFISPLLWSPGKPESPQESPLGVLGRTVYDTQFSTSPDGIQFARSQNAQVINAFDWSHVPLDRFQTILARGGEYTRFYDQVLRRAQKFFLYRGVAENEDSTDPVTWPIFRLGPYGFRQSGTKGMSWPFARSKGLKELDRMVDVSLDVIVVPEWGVS